MNPDVPLVVPEVNGADVEDHKGIISIPNCSTTPLVMVLKPLMEVNPVKRVIADTYQSVSGTGAAAVEELRVQSKQLTNDDSLTYDDLTPDAYPHPIAFNALPHIEPFLENGYTNEEMKMVNETRKILHAPDIAVSATCVRVPVMLSHSEALHIEFENPISPRRGARDSRGLPRNQGGGRPACKCVSYAHRGGGGAMRFSSGAFVRMCRTPTA